MRFLTGFAALRVAIAPSVMAQGQNPNNCLDECFVHSEDWVASSAASLFNGGVSKQRVAALGDLVYD
ncbi:hypothetical protein BBP40_008463 [Aspergillus hancockii]|nr:hypothetical protein BBP40_008463 [Aspergillus hancockii]